MKNETTKVERSTRRKRCFIQCVIACLALVGFSAAFPQQSPLQQSLPRVPPTEPAQALQTFRTLDGFSMELLAAEPLVTDPVAMDYDENGRAFVVEMSDYPYTDKSTDKPFVERTTDLPIGRVRVLSDHNGDGRFDKSTIFAEDLSWPTGVVCWNGGIFVAATPDIWYLKDTDGDGRADLRRQVFTGFRKFNVQAVMNNLKWGLDHWIYGAGASNGGDIRPGHKPDAQPIVLGRNDFRFDPVTEAFEVVSGGARFGNTFDDWGNRFVCNIRNPVQHVVLPSHYLARNRFLPVPSAVHDAAEAGDTLPVYRSSPPEPWRVLNARRLASDRSVVSPRSETVAVGYVTSSSGVTVYRGNAYPPQYYGNVFVAEVAGNLILRQALTPHGVTFAAQRADEKKEFVSSTDNWFRPVNFINAPDGTLHVLDMYRETIEHPWSIPDDIKAHLDLESGRDRGRIYRLTPPGFQLPAPPRLGSATTEELVKALGNPNSWWRDTAHRLLFERRDPAAVPRLREIVDRSRGDSRRCTAEIGGPTPPVTIACRQSTHLQRLHALWSLHGLGSLRPADLRLALDDSCSGVREHAVRLAEHQFNSTDLLNRVLDLAADPAVRVRFQVAFTLGEVRDRRAVAALARIASQDAADPWVRTAVLSSAAGSAGKLLEDLLNASGASEPSREMIGLIKDVAFVLGARNVSQDVKGALAAAAAGQANHAGDEIKATQYGIIVGLGEGLRRAGKRLVEYEDPSDAAGTGFVRRAMDEASRTVDNDAVPVAIREQAVRLLAQSDFRRSRVALSRLLDSRQPDAIQVAAVQTLTAFRDDDLPALLLGRYRNLTPSVRGEVVEALLSRPERIDPLLSAVEARIVAASDIPLARRGLLMRHTNPDIRQRSLGLFAHDAPSPRQTVMSEYRSALTLDGDRDRGQKVLERECLTCHRLSNRGHDIGPALETVLHRTPEELLVHILDPNREVAPNYLEYAIALKDGRVTTGMIASETPTSITLRRAENVQETILRADIDEITSSGNSLMPEGLEKKIAKQEMADLLEFFNRAK